MPRLMGTPSCMGTISVASVPDLNTMPVAWPDAWSVIIPHSMQCGGMERRDFQKDLTHFNLS